MDENRTKELAHRSATKYWHNHAGPSGCQYGFTETHLTDFARALLSEHQKDTMFIVGVKDGNETVLGTAQITPEMKMLDIVRDLFGEPTPDGTDDASMALYALQNFYNWMRER